MGWVLKAHDRFWNDIAVYGDYLPWNVHKAMGGDRTNWPEHNGLILDLKGNSAHAVAHFKEMIEPELSQNVVIVTVPSHDPAKVGGGLAMLSAALAAGGSRIDGSACLVRTRKIAKLAHGGDRSKDVHLNSIAVAHAELIVGRSVFLIDDVTKSGNSLAACRELLLKAGAAVVVCATIGKT